MKSIKLSALFAALGLAFAAGTVKGQYLAINVAATVYEQAPDTTSGNKAYHNTYQVKITTKDILNLIAENTGFYDGFYDGYTLAQYSLYGNFAIFLGNPNKGGSLAANVPSDLLRTQYSSTTRPSSYAFNGSTHVYSNISEHYIQTMYFDDVFYNDDGNQFTFTGAHHLTGTENAASGKFNLKFAATGPIEGYLKGYNFSGTATVTGSAAN